MPCGWEGNHRSGVTLAMRHRLQWFIHLWAHGLDRKMSTPPMLSCGAWPIYLYLKHSAQCQKEPAVQNTTKSKQSMTIVDITLYPRASLAGRTEHRRYSPTYPICAAPVWVTFEPLTMNLNAAKKWLLMLNKSTALAAICKGTEAGNLVSTKSPILNWSCSERSHTESHYHRNQLTSLDCDFIRVRVPFSSSAVSWQQQQQSLCD